MENMHRATTGPWIIGSLIAILVTAFGFLPLPTEARIEPSESMALHAAPWAVPIDKNLNLHQMSPLLYRSALPRQSDLALLQSLDIRTVVSFIRKNDAQWADLSTMTLVSLPVHADRIDDTDVITALRALHVAQSRGPVLMHCKHGRNRTGLMAAMYRIVLQGWNKEAALMEMQQGGFGDPQHMQQATRYVTRVNVAQLQQAYARGDCSTRRVSTCRLRAWWAAW
ncbi:tyrosine-protein phosphatase [Pseudomonas zeae]|uniref:phosphatase domain-containing protein n=1 Tax=Pseudomonas zeae TaxID=2745510 RepID=UPI0039E07717